MQSSVMWKELTAEDLRERAAADAIVVLPVASTEQHGPHLPVGVDTVLCEAVCRAAAERARDHVPVVVAPTLWCGMAEHHMAHGGTFTFDIPTYRAVLLALLRSLERHGFGRVFIVNGHGGNIAALASFLPDFARATGLQVRATTYFELAQPAIATVLEDQDRVRHACEAETSMMLALVPDWVKPQRFAEATGDPAINTRPVVGRFRSFKEFTASGVIGDARRASAAKGDRLLAACAAALAAELTNEETWR